MLQLVTSREFLIRLTIDRPSFYLFSANRGVKNGAKRIFTQYADGKRLSRQAEQQGGQVTNLPKLSR